MKTNLLIIGKKSFIAKNLYNYSKKKRFTKLSSLREFLNLNLFVITRSHSFKFLIKLGMYIGSCVPSESMV